MVYLHRSRDSVSPVRGSFQKLELPLCEIIDDAVTDIINKRQPRKDI